MGKDCSEVRANDSRVNEGGVAADVVFKRFKRPVITVLQGKLWSGSNSAALASTSGVYGRFAEGEHSVGTEDLDGEAETTGSCVRFCVDCRAGFECAASLAEKDPNACKGDRGALRRSGFVFLWCLEIANVFVCTRSRCSAVCVNGM